MSTLLVDNYDSYTYNVFHLLAAASGQEPIVIHNDMISWRALSRWDFDAIVLSPGPGRPERWHDFGICSDILRCSEIPVLGVCLGHQGLGHLLNGEVSTAPIVMHGRLSEVKHSGEGLFHGIPQDFQVVRYHSLAVTGSLGEEGRVSAWTEDGVVMGLEHTERPMWGVQFHPESIATQHGLRLCQNFYRLARERRIPRRRMAAQPTQSRPRPARPEVGVAISKSCTRELLSASVKGQPECEQLFARLFGELEHAFWLDSADAPTRLAQRSFMGTSAGPHSSLLEYDVHEGIVTRTDVLGEHTSKESIFETLAIELERLHVPLPDGLPRGLLGGFVGYLGYECKADCQSPNVHRSDVPDAVMMLANRVIAVDHVNNRTHIYALVDDGDRAEASSWLEHAERTVRDLIGVAPPPPPELSIEPPQEPVVFRLGRGREQYLADIARCQAALAAGESYEVCLTDQIHTDASPDPFELYTLLRKVNPSPFAAYLKLGELAIVSSSPERFLSVDRDRRVEARPIKGTTSRSQDPARDRQLRDWLRSDEKTFAEHLMIVDLLRNDLGRACEVGTVEVPEFMIVEPYTSVHQLVSTITGRLEIDRSPVSCVRSCFPGGSMTGAPKLRTMEIIDDIEREARGVYSGAIGYLGVDGAIDLNIVIRTIVMRPGHTSIGAGGAIVMQSDPQDEFDEILLKARAPMSAIARALTASSSEKAFRVELEPAMAVSR